MSNFWIAVVALVVALLSLGTYAWIGEPDRHIEFYTDQDITCWWDNIDGFAWCALVATGDERCSWHVEFWGAKMSKEDVPARCWPSATEDGRDA